MCSPGLDDEMQEQPEGFRSGIGPTEGLRESLMTGAHFSFSLASSLLWGSRTTFAGFSANLAGTGTEMAF